MITQFVGPALAGVLYFGILRSNFTAGFYRKSPTIGNLVGAGFVAASTILWVNLSPFYT